MPHPNSLLNKTMVQVDRSTPTTALEAFLSALTRGDMATAILCVDGAQTSKFSDLMGQMFKKVPMTWQASDIHATQDGDTAKITYSLTVKLQSRHEATSPDSTASQNTLATIDEVKFRKALDGWLLIPSDVKQMQTQNTDSASTYATLLAFPTFAENSSFGKTLAAAADKAQTAQALSNMKQIGLGILEYAMDHKDKYPSNAETFKSVLYPYVKNDVVFVCPVSGNAFNLNNDLAGKSMMDVREPSRTVMTYDGADNHLDFHHQGYGLVGFADGSCRRVSKDDADTLIWQP